VERWPGTREPAPSYPEPDVLVVCTANICRSPTLHFLLENGLAAPPGVGLSVASAGVLARDDQPMCRTSAAAIAHLEGGRAFARRHASRAAVPDLVESAGMVLVATEALRRRLVEHSPAVRDRTFTMLEAARLAVSADQAAPAGPAPVDGRALASRWSARRGLDAPTAPPRRRWGRHRDPTPLPLDLADPHLDGVQHGPVLHDVHRTATTLVASLRRLHDRRDGPEASL